MLCDRKGFLLKLMQGVPVCKWRSIAGLLVWFGLGFAPLSLEAESYDEADIWLTLFEKPRALAGTDKEADEISSLSLYGRIGIKNYNDIFFKDQDGKVPFYGYKQIWPEGYTSTATNQAIQTTSLYDALKPRSITSQSVSRELLYRVVQEDSVILIEKAYFEESGKWLSQLNTKKRADREQLKIFADNSQYILERKGNKVDVWEIVSTFSGHRIFESIVIAGAGNTLKFYNGRPPLIGDEDDWTIKVEHSGFINDRLNYIETQDAEMGWLLRQKGETMGVRVSKGIVTMRAQVDSGRLYTAYMTDESFIANALVLFGQYNGVRSLQDGTFDGVGNDFLENQPIQFSLGNFSLSFTGASNH